MKIIKLFSITLLALLTFTSCEKEPDNIFEPDTSIDYASEIAANYEGFYTSKTIEFDDQYTVTVTRIDNGHIRVTGEDFGTFETDIFMNRDNQNILHNNVHQYKDITVVYDRTTKELVFTLEKNEETLVTFVGEKM